MAQKPEDVSVSGKMQSMTAVIYIYFSCVTFWLLASQCLPVMHCIYICQIAWCENFNVIIKSSSMRWLLRAVLLHISSPWPACSLTTSSISMLIALWEMSSIEAMCPFRCTSATPDSFAVWVWRLPCVNAVNGEVEEEGDQLQWDLINQKFWRY